jgi:hypothetical protein
LKTLSSRPLATTWKRSGPIPARSPNIRAAAAERTMTEAEARTVRASTRRRIR